MIIDSIEVDNYGAFYGNHAFRFSGRGLVMIVGENKDEPRMNSNGAAKSTLPEALDWCLFGEVPKGDHADSIINDESKSARVRATLIDDDGTQIRVQRHRKWPGETRGLRVWRGSDELTTLDDRETQSVLENHIGMDRDVFHAAIFFAQTDTFNFADATDSERLEILSKIYQLGAVEEMLDKAKDERNKIATQLATEQGKMATLGGMHQQLSAIDYSQQITAYEQQRTLKLQQLEQQAREVQGYVAQAQLQIANEPQARAALTAIEAARPQLLTVFALDPVYDDAIQNAQIGLAKFTNEAAQLQGKIAKMRTMRVGDCRECGQPITADHVEREVARMAWELEQANRYKAEWQGELKKHNDARLVAQQALDMQAAQLNVALGKWQTDANTAREAVRHYEEVRRYVGQTEGALANLQREASTITSQLNPHVAQAQDIQGKLAALVLDTATLAASVRVAEVALAHVDFWITGLGPKGLKNYILDTKLQEMTDASNEWVKILTGGTIWVRFETQTMGRSTGKLSNKLNVRVFRYNKNGTTTERNYRSWSGGEKKRVAFAIAFGLSRLVAARSKKRYDTLILDEVFKYVDRAGKDAVVEMLKKIKQEKSSVFVIEHDADFQGAFEQRVLIRKENGRSRIVEEVSGQRIEESGAGDQTRAEGTESSGGVQASPALPRRRPTRKPVA